MRRRFNQLDGELGSIACPTLVVRGEESFSLTDEDAERVAREIPEASWVSIQGAGHTIQGDNPRDLAAALHEFLRTA